VEARVIPRPLPLPRGRPPPRPLPLPRAGAVMKGGDGERAMGYTSAIAIRVIKMIYPSHQTRIGTADRLLGFVRQINFHRNARVQSLRLGTRTRTSFISNLSQFDGIFLKHLAGSVAKTSIRFESCTIVLYHQLPGRDALGSLPFGQSFHSRLEDSKSWELMTIVRVISVWLGEIRHK
jgi:hypothetical protein